MDNYMMFPKPPKRKHKSKHITNDRIKDYILCGVCGLRPAYATHEVFHDGTSYTRNMCIENEWQEKVCMQCDEEIHRTDHVLDRKLKQKWQRKIMKQMSWDIESWREETHLKNYLKEE